MTGRVGIREVARHAGVSIGTVSNVLNKPESVSARNLQRVTEVMNELGFVRNDLARQLKMGGGTTLGMIVLNVANPFFAALAHACEAEAEKEGYTIVVGSSDQLADREDRYAELFEQQRVTGMIIAPLDGPTARIEQLRRRGMPVVLFDFHSDTSPFCSLALDGRRGGYLAARHLVETGRKHIAFLGGPLRQVEDRWIGAMAACSETSGVRLSHIDTPDQTVSDGRAAGAALREMDTRDRPDAIFAANDLLGLGLMQSVVLDKHLRIPEDLAIVGYDDIDYAASAMVPMSSVRQPVEMLARESIRLVLGEKNADAEHVHEHLLLEPELIMRESSRMGSPHSRS
jgi:LacI family transcriptional regulator